MGPTAPTPDQVMSPTQIISRMFAGSISLWPAAPNRRPPEPCVYTGSDPGGILLPVYLCVLNTSHKHETWLFLGGNLNPKDKQSEYAGAVRRTARGDDARKSTAHQPDPNQRSFLASVRMCGHMQTEQVFPASCQHHPPTPTLRTLCCSLIKSV